MTSYVYKIKKLMISSVATNEIVSFESLWAENDVVFYFLRRFGCPLCRWISNELNSINSVLAQNNTKLVGIAPEKFGLEEFQQGKYFTGDLYLDESKKSYVELGFTRFSFFGSLGAAIASSTRRMVNEAKINGISGNIQGDTRQLGGMLIVKKGGEQIFYFKQVEAADYVKNSEILKVLGIEQEVKDSEQASKVCNLEEKSCE